MQVLASVGDAPRIRDLLEMAKETKEELAKQKPDVRTMFEDVFEELPWHLQEQMAQALEERAAKWPK